MPAGAQGLDDAGVQRGDEARLQRMSVDDKNAQSLTLRPARARRLNPRAALGGDEEFDARRGDQHLPDFVLEQPIGVGDPLAQMHELEPQLDEVGLLVAAELAGVLENSPCERAVAATLVPELVEGAQERGAVLGVDPVFDLHQDRPAIVVDLLMGLRLAPMLRRRKVKRGALLQASIAR